MNKHESNDPGAATREAARQKQMTKSLGLTIVALTGALAIMLGGRLLG